MLRRRWWWPARGHPAAWPGSTVLHGRGHSNASRPPTTQHTTGVLGEHSDEATERSILLSLTGVDGRSKVSLKESRHEGSKVGAGVVFHQDRKRAERLLQQRVAIFLERRQRHRNNRRSHKSLPVGVTLNTPGHNNPHTGSRENSGSALTEGCRDPRIKK